MYCCDKIFHPVNSEYLAGLQHLAPSKAVKY